MSKYVRYCSNCNKKDPNLEHAINGRYSTYLKEDDYNCHYCGCKVVDTKILSKDWHILGEISIDHKFLDSMIKLAESDPIEYQLKLSQFKVQLAQIQKTKEESNKIHCPKCNSTAITSGARGVNYFWGLIGASKTVNRCGNCGYTWKP